MGLRTTSIITTPALSVCNLASSSRRRKILAVRLTSLKAPLNQLQPCPWYGAESVIWRRTPGQSSSRSSSRSVPSVASKIPLL
ncbi:hypothetical protein BDW74DRAFT_151430 [Aspergillus multicolor]|uniref:uncharacterized protein n=1 Tax=Aspergillus multicolor TaxID=41759 RepID=UPI003CCDBBD1